MYFLKHVYPELGGRMKKISGVTRDRDAQVFFYCGPRQSSSTSKQTVSDLGEGWGMKDERLQCQRAMLQLEQQLSPYCGLV